MTKPEEELELELDFAGAIGATEGVSSQMLTLYIPNKDRNGRDFESGEQRRWVKQAAQILARIGGGVTVMPPVEGGWLDPQSGHIVWENPILVYTYIIPEQFREMLPELRTFIHRLGRTTNQGEMVLEFNERFYRITTYDEEET